MTGSEAQRRQTRVDVCEPVVVVRDAQVALVGRVFLAVSYQRRLPTVMELVPRDCDEVALALGVDLSVVKVLVDLERRLKVVVIDPDICRLFDADQVHGSGGFRQFEVAEDYVLGAFDEEACQCLPCNQQDKPA